MLNDSYTLGLYEKSMPNNLGFYQMLCSTQECGFDQLELSIDETEQRLARLDFTAQQKKEIIKFSNDTGIPIKTMCLSGHRKFPLGSRDSQVRDRALEIMKKAIDFSSYLGIRIIQLAGYDVYYEQGDTDTEKYFCENLAKSTEIAAKNGIILAFETMETQFMDTVTKSMKYVNKINSPWLGLYPDIGNLKNSSVLYGTDLVEDIKNGTGNIFAAHLKETKPGIYRDMNFGEGHTDYESSIKALWDMGVRIYTGEFWYLGEDNYKDTLLSSANFLRNKIENCN